MFFLERSGFFAALLDTRPSSKSLTVCADALTPACCHSWASSVLVVPRSQSWFNFETVQALAGLSWAPWRLLLNNLTALLEVLDEPINSWFRCNLTVSNILLCEALFVQSNDDGTSFLACTHGRQRKNNDSKHHPPFEASSLVFELNHHYRVISSIVFVNTHTCVNERITDCQLVLLSQVWNAVEMFFGGFSAFAWQRGTLQLIGIHLITLHNILEYMQIAIIQIEAANFVKIYICVILKTFGHDRRLMRGKNDLINVIKMWKKSRGLNTFWMHCMSL